MNKDQQRIEIAELCGWRFVLDEKTGSHAVYSPDSSIRMCWCRLETNISDLYKWDLPNYHGDLNACAAFEATLNTVDAASYRKLIVDYGNRESDAAALCHATAPQRCEAFLRLKGKWND